LIELLLKDGRQALADRVRELSIHSFCCDGHTCASFWTVADPTKPHPPGFCTLPLRAGELHLDILDDEILYVEVLSRDDLRARIRAALS